MSGRIQTLLVAVIIETITIYTIRNRGASDLAGQRAIDRATPVCLAMLPHQDDLYAGAEETWGATLGQAAHVYWDVAFSDSQGNKLIHVIGDAESGAVRRVKNVKRPNPTPLDRNKPPLSAEQVVERAHAWMRILGFAEDWQLAASPSRGAVLWHVRLQASGMSARLDLDPLSGTLIFADITPAR